MCSLGIWFGKLRPLKRHGASCPTMSVAPVLAITSAVAMTSWLRFIDPVGEFSKPFVTWPSRILSFIEENRDEGA